MVSWLIIQWRFPIRIVKYKIYYIVLHLGENFQKDYDLSIDLQTDI